MLLTAQMIRLKMDSKIGAKYEKFLEGPHYEETLIARREDEDDSCILADRVRSYLKDIGKSLWGNLYLDNEEDFWPTRIENYYVGGASIQLTEFIRSEELPYPHVSMKIFNKGKVSGLADLIIEDFPEFEEYRKRVF